EGLWKLYTEVERPLISILAGMEQVGVGVDTRRLGELSREFAGRLATLEDDVYRLAGGPFNINSGPQLREVLFEKLKLPTLQKTPGGEQSTAQDVLEALAARHPLPALLLQHRQLSKLKSTYLDALPALVHPEDGRLRAPGGLAALDSRLFADRAAHPGPLLGRSRPQPGLRARSRHPQRGGRPDLWRSGIASRRVDAARGQDGELRGDLWPEPLWAGRPPGNLSGRGRRLHRFVLPGIRGRGPVHHADPGGCSGRGARRDDPGSAAADLGDQEHHRPEPQPRRANRGQHRDPGV